MANLSSWTWEQKKAFEIALALNSADIYENKWDTIASQIPGNKTIEEIKLHYLTLLEDLDSIEAGIIPPPSYNDTHTPITIPPIIVLASPVPKNDPTSKNKKKKAIKKKDSDNWGGSQGNPWTETEHKLFLRGMKIHGRGAWKIIARDFVTTRLPKQIASHAQKYFKRQVKQKEEFTKWSISYITSENSCDISSNITGGNNNNDTKIKENNGVEGVHEEKVGEVQSLTSELQYVSPPMNWCLENDDDFNFFMHIDECLSNISPNYD